MNKLTIMNTFYKHQESDSGAGTGGTLGYIIIVKNQ